MTDQVRQPRFSWTDDRMNFLAVLVDRHITSQTTLKGQKKAIWDSVITAACNSSTLFGATVIPRADGGHDVMPGENSGDIFYDVSIPFFLFVRKYIPHHLNTSFSILRNGKEILMGSKLEDFRPSTKKLSFAT